MALDFSLEEQAKLERSQTVRDQVITKLLEKGVPDNFQAMDLLLKATNDVDGQILKKKRLSTDDKSAQNQAQILELTSQLLMKRSKRTAQQAAPQEQSIGNVQAGPLVPGQTAPGVQAFGYDRFMAGDGTPLPENA